MKKGVFTVVNYFAPKRGVLSIHCSATADKDTGRSSLLFGLSGTGKTTLSADPKRHLNIEEIRDNVLFSLTMAASSLQRRPRLSRPRLSRPRLSRARMNRPKMKGTRMSGPRGNRPTLSPLRMSPLRMSPLRMSPLRMSPLRMSPLRMSPLRMSRLSFSHRRISCRRMSLPSRGPEQEQASKPT